MDLAHPTISYTTNANTSISLSSTLLRNLEADKAERRQQHGMLGFGSRPRNPTIIWRPDTWVRSNPEAGIDGSSVQTGCNGVCDY